MMNKLPAIGAVHTGCLNCSDRPATLPMDHAPGEWVAVERLEGFA